MNAIPEPTVSPTPSSTCCTRRMTTIVVTHEDASRLTLHTCSCCGGHVWERDGTVLDREAVLGIVRERIADGTPRKVPAPRRQVTLPLRVEIDLDAARARERSTSQERRDLLAGFTVQGGGQQDARP